jgi:hypothetical protein
VARVVLALLAAALLALRSFEDTNFKRELKLQSMFEEDSCPGDLHPLATTETWPILHTPRDQFSAVHLDG